MKYPNEIASFIKKTSSKDSGAKTFAVDARFTKNEDNKPLKVFDDTFSRFVFTVIQDGSAATCNVPIEDLAYMEAASMFAFNQQMTIKSTPAGSSPAYTERFVTGNLKGKSPADVLAENGENGKKILNEQYTWLKNNLEKYPANKKLMDAIMDASKLNIEDVKNNTANTSVVKILDIGCRPLTRKTREDGKCFCYEGYITWTSGQNYPVYVEIKNYYAPVKKNEDGTLNVQLKEKDAQNEKRHVFSMTAQEWLHVIAEMKLRKDSFVLTNFAKAYSISEAANKEAREQKAS